MTRSREEMIQAASTAVGCTLCRGEDEPDPTDPRHRQDIIETGSQEVPGWEWGV